MKTTVVGVLAAIAIGVSGQVTYNNTTNTFVCPPSGGAYCAGDSGETNIIIRCTGTVGYPGNCDDNLAGEPPVGDSYATCVQSTPQSGDAACSKNGIVYSQSAGPASPSTSTGIVPYPTGGYNSTTPIISTTTKSPTGTTRTTVSTTSTIRRTSTTIAIFTGGAAPTQMVQKVVGGAAALLLGALAI